MDLTKSAGFEVYFDPESGELVFPQIPDFSGPAIRKLDDARDFLMDPQSTGPEVLYWMYRGVSLPQDREKIESANLRYDITVFSPGKIGKEYVKSIGHYHPKTPSGEAYPEIYEVLFGEAVFLLQDENVADAIVIEASRGAQVFVPPGYGHVTINPSKDFLVTANVISNKFTSEYGVFREHHGGCYYCVGAENERRWIVNPSYQKHPPLRFLGPTEMPVLNGLFSNLYESLAKDPKIFVCMNIPEMCPAF